MCCAVSCPTLCDPMDWSPPGSSVPGDSPGKNTGVGCYALLQGIFPTLGLNSGLPHCKWILYQLSHQGSPWILQWVACLFSRGTSWPRNWTSVSCIAGGFFISWAVNLSFMFLYCCSLVTKSCLTLCDLMDCNTPVSSVLHYPLEFPQIHVHWVGDAL